MIASRCFARLAQWMPAFVPAVVLIAGCTPGSEPSVPISTGTQFSVTGNTEAVYFDMQGILWRLPPGGGEAVALTDAGDDLRRVQLSPDGQWLAAQSFATGAWDIVVMRTDGSARRNLTASPADDREPAWSADGRALLFTSDRAGNEDIWSLDIASGERAQLTSDPADDYASAPLGGAVLFVSNRGGKPGLYLLDTTTEPGAEPALIHRPPAGRLHAPRVSPDGRSVAFVQAARRNAFPGVAVNELIVLDIETDADNIRGRTLSDTGSDVFPMPPAWLDDDTLLATTDGHIQRIDPGTGDKTPLPFTARLPLTRNTFTPKTPLAFAQDSQPALGLVDPVMLRDDAIVFTALGDLWRLDADGELTPLTDDAFVERDVTVSPDGQQLAFISDRPDQDEGGGDMQIWLYDLATGEMNPVTDRSYGPRYPTFSPDGALLAFQQVGPRGTQDFTVRVLDLASGKSRKLRSSPKIWPGRMSFSADGAHITVAELHRTSGRVSDGRNRLVRIDIAADTATPIELPDDMTPDTGPVASPDGRQLALIIDGALWLWGVTADGQPDGTRVKALDELVESPAFSRDGRRIAVLTTNGLEVIDLDTGARLERNPALTWQPAAGSGQQLIHAGRLWDGTGDDYRRDVDVLIEDGRIKSIQPHTPHTSRWGDIPVIDAGARTVLPGLIDHHVHFEPHKGEWVGRSLLAFGITTVVEPGGLPYESREHMESWLSGRRAGPRLVFAGPQLDGARRTFHFASHINNEQRLQWELARGERLGYGLLKTYRRMRPDLQARTIALGHARGWPVTAHAGLRNVGTGGDRTEHLAGASRTLSSAKQSEWRVSYDDMLAIYSLPQAAVTPTLVNQGGFFDFALRFPGYADNPQYRALFTKAYRQNLAGFTRVVGKNIELIREGLGNAGATLKALDERGATIVAGTDSPIFPYGLALVIELQGYVEAGLSPAAALRTATVNAARVMGAGDRVGRLEAGFLADLVIVDGDPLMRMTDLMDVDGVMVNGRYFGVDALLQ
jgi:Tol biopolymer transport system component